jgi:hypothetical protein
VDDGSIVLRPATGPRYGRIWDAHVVDALVERFGDGISGYWRVPGVSARSEPSFGVWSRGAR